MSGAQAVRAMVAVVHTREFPIGSHKEGAVHTSELVLIDGSFSGFIAQIVTAFSLIMSSFKFNRLRVEGSSMPGCSITHWYLNKKPAAGIPWLAANIKLSRYRQA